MAYTIINSSNSINNTTNSANALTLGADSSAIIMADGYVLATGSLATGIYLGGNETTLIVNGFVFGTFDGIRSVGDYAHTTVHGQVAADSTGVRISDGGRLYVSPTGVVSGGYEAVAMNSSTVVNDGTLSGGNQAIQMSSGWLTNNGLMSASSDAIFYVASGEGYITNTGRIQGDLSTFYDASAETAKLRVDNSGEWNGRLGLTPGDDTVNNTGRITDGVSLGNGNNTLDSRYGFIGGDVTAGNGADTILLGGEDTIILGGGGGDTIDGGAGFDIVSYATSTIGVRVDLLNGIYSDGDAQGDRLSNIEGVYGTQFRDVLIGDNGSNVINGVLGGDKLLGNGGNDTIIMLGGGGKPVINGGAGNDIIQMVSLDSAVYGYAFKANVQVNGGSGYDTLEIGSAPASVFTNVTVVNIERIMVNDGFNYTFTSAQGTVAAGARLWVDGGSLTGANYISFNGSVETDGAFDFTGGAGRDTFVGGAGADTIAGGGDKDIMTGGGGADTFIYNNWVESTFGQRDKILDFNTAADTFQFDVEVTAVDPMASGSVTSSGDLAALVSGQFGASHAMLVNVTGGSLSGRMLLLVDGNGVAGFQAAGDYVLDVSGIVGTLTVADFIV